MVIFREPWTSYLACASWEIRTRDFFFLRWPRETGILLPNSQHRTSHAPKDVLPSRISASYRAACCLCPRYRDSSLIRNSASLGPYRRTMPRALWWSLGGGPFVMGKVPLYCAPYRWPTCLGVRLCWSPICELEADEEERGREREGERKRERVGER